MSTQHFHSNMRVTVFILCASLAVLTSGEESGRGFTPRPALVILLVQDCFMSGGTIPVKDAEAVIPVINRIRALPENKFKVVVQSQDWHCPRHVSFASTNPQHGVGETIKLKYIQNTSQLCLGGSITRENYPGAVDCSSQKTFEISQHLWPDHCVQNVSTGPTSAALSKDLTVLPTDWINHKGTDCNVDSYSAFYDAAHASQTGLDIRLKEAGINTIFVTGLTLDYSVLYTALDAKLLGYETYVVLDATVNWSSDSKPYIEKFTENGVHVINSEDIGSILQDAASSASCNHGNKRGHLIVFFFIVMTVFLKFKFLF